MTDFRKAIIIQNLNIESSQEILLNLINKIIYKLLMEKANLKNNIEII